MKIDVVARLLGKMNASSRRRSDHSAHPRVIPDARRERLQNVSSTFSDELIFVQATESHESTTAATATGRRSAGSA